MGWWKLMKQSLHSFSQGIHICSFTVWDCRNFWGILTDPSVVALKDGDGKARKGLILNKKVGISHIHKEYEELLWSGNSSGISKHGRQLKDFKWVALVTNHFFFHFCLSLFEQHYNCFRFLLSTEQVWFERLIEPMNSYQEKAQFLRTIFVFNPQNLIDNFFGSQCRCF